MREKIHLGRKEALEVMKPYKVGRPTLERWIRNERGLYVKLPGRQRGHIMRARLVQLLNTRTGTGNA